MGFPTFNEFQRELLKREIKPQEAFLFTMMYERMGQMATEIEQCTQLILSMANSLQGVVGLQGAQAEQLRQIMRGRKPDGVDVMSVANDPSERN